MKIALVSLPYLPYYMRNARCDFVSLSKTQWYPLWLGYCGALLEKYNHETILLDAPAYDYNKEQSFKIIREFKPDMLVVYGGLLSKEVDVELTDELCDELKIPVVFVGPYVSVDAEDFLKRSKKVELAVVGEFENPILEYVSGKPVKEIKNFVIKENDKIIQNEIRPYLNTQQLDEIPYVSRYFNEHLNLKKYKAISEYQPYLDIMTGRGCEWGLCTYCLWVHNYIKGQTYNKRSVDNVISELEYIVKEMPHIRSIMFQDDTFTGERAKEISEAIIKKKLKVIWSCYARPNMDIETLKLMKAAGCRNLHVGFESANPVVLKNIKKGINKDKMLEFAINARKAKLRLHADFAIGFDGETKEGIKETIRFAKKAKPHTAQFQLMIPFPKTPFYDHLKENNWLNQNGEPNYPQLSNDELRKMAKYCYRKFYFSWNYFFEALKHPYDRVLTRLDTIFKAIPNMFWKRWKIR